MKLEKLFTDQIDEIGDQHLSSSRVTPMRPDAFDLSNSEKIPIDRRKNARNTLRFGYGSY